jgi:branched-chain amino acid transport system ATP-binding protein
MIELNDIHSYYGESHILHGVSLKVAAGQILALVGRNGVGKTTLLRSIMGLVEVRSGQILIEGQDITNLPPHKVARSGCTFIPDDRGIFPGLTVLEHLRLGPLSEKRRPDLLGIFSRFPILQERGRQRADLLSGGERTILATARAILMHPKVLLIDEMSEGVQPNVVEEQGRLVRELADEGIAIILVEQDARFALRIADLGCVMEKGNLVLKGTAKELLSNKTALQAHLIV